MPIHHLLSFQENLQNQIGKKLLLKINDNRSTMLSVKWGPNYTKVSLHRLFLNAPQNVMQALICYLKREDKKLAPSIKAYIESELQQLDYSYELNHTLLQTRGRVYDLKEMYEQLNREYFHLPIELSITWFGEKRRRSCKRMTFGLYQNLLRLIKINRSLDHPNVPPYFVSYIIYHEMLHHVCPSYIDANGKNQIHNKKFKEKEKEFKYFKEAQQWVREHARSLP